jgi:hypothetical protein
LSKIESLVEDIYGVFDKEVKIDEGAVKALSEDIARIVSDQFDKRKTHLRLSNLGKPCRRQLWYSINTPELGEKLSGPTRIKFIIGHITEAVVLFLATLAGHAVTDQQKQVQIDGVKGHIDGLIDGELVDVKSASPYSFSKFKEGLQPGQDAFGYLSQLGSYGAALGKSSGSFLAVDKVLGHLTLDTHELPEKDYGKDVRDVRAILAANKPPDRAYSDVPEGASGNRKLDVACSYCEFKHTCWPGVQTYAYSRGPVFLTRVVRPPRVDRA